MIVDTVKCYFDGAGGVSPVLRSSSFNQNTLTPSLGVFFPSGAQAGDFAILMVAGGDAVSSFSPTGWATVQSNSPATGWNAAIYSKTLDAADITAGLVTITKTGNFQMDAVMWCFNGAPAVLDKIIGSSLTSGSVNGHAFSFGSTIPLGAIVLMAATGRGNSTPAITPGTQDHTDSKASGSMSSYNYTMPSAGVGSFTPSSIVSAYEYVFMAVAIG
jgi:hypothetical protein